ncbi:Concanavalin A-like lectin/glucanases superfamily [Penicillium taxi]|uniref:Concanavalin A-like lectin/glucanases superfamily n=1 Tax=Penicillium taxi TaxID=168475 RepID=UPI00254560D6|nr:Concanavalin A-like lectin/glucanases superfamily [Penicillium taxi]KAJ5899989.1 Concanavalin A-like lectin/glucanases superfamily [Penicillium taxi]
MAKSKLEQTTAKDFKYFPIKGIPVNSAAGGELGFDTEVPIRQNIDSWSKNPANDKQVTLFVLALKLFQELDPADRDSYFQIAGIHGQPNVPWDEPIDSADALNKGYCTHNNILFPVWHRAYLALYEQRIWEIMIKKVVPQFTKDRASWEAAAQTWRLPFWDWGISSSVPDLCKYPIFVVPAYDGKGVRSINNPLFQFHMPTDQPMSTAGVDNFKDPWVPNNKGEILFFGECIGTSRWPQEGDNASGSAAWKLGVVNNYKVQDALKKPSWLDDSPYGQPAEMVFRLLTIPMEYSTFATTAQLSGDVKNDNNLEYIHNNIHGWVGGDFNGHMSQIPVATFDPIFWLHHCNIDRLFALWQGKNPDKWFEELEGDKVNKFFQEIIGMDIGDKITENTKLRPFHKDVDGTVMTPVDVRFPYSLGYTYPELQTWKYDPPGYSASGFIQDLNKSINDLYGLSRKELIDASSALKGVEYNEDGTKSLDFSLSIRYRKYAFGGDPFWIRIFLSQDGKTQNPTTDFVTEVYNFSQKPEERSGKLACSNCKDNQTANIKSTANISLTPVLISIIKAGKGEDLASLSRDDVLTYLKERAYWRVFKGGVELPRNQLDPLDLEIVGSTNNSTNFKDATKAPLLENFKEEPAISGGADGALDPKLKQPMTTPPPEVPNIPKASLKLNSFLPFPSDLKTDSVVIIDSSSLDITPVKTSGIDNTQVWFSDTKSGDGNIVFLLSIRRAEKQIVFNTCLENKWGEEVRVALENRFKGTTPSILVHDQGDGYEVFIDWRHVAWFEKRAKDKVARSVSYTVNDGQAPVLATQLKVKVYDSMGAMFQH